MNINAALDVAMGLVLMYLVLSLFCTTINELITTAVSLRARTLKKTLQQLIDDPRLKTLFYDHGLIDGSKVAVSGGNKAPSTPAVPSNAPPLAALSPITATTTPRATRTGDAWYAFSHPSYLSGQTVASALTGSLMNYINSDQPIPVDTTFASLQAAVQQLKVDSNIRDAMTACLADANNNVDEFRKRVAAWFDNSMSRLSGSYTRNLQIVSFVVGLALAVGFNANTLRVADKLWNDHALGEVVTQIAGKFSASADPAKEAIALHPDCQSPDKDNNISQSISTMCALDESLRPLPLGWNDKPYKDCEALAWAVLGWLITAVALMKGAPFWFDLLQKVMNFRATGDKPKTAATTT
jgi:transposase-like protein